MATVLTVRLGDETYAIPIQAVAEVLPALPIESMPQCPTFVRGAVFVRGRLIPVVGAAERLRLEGHDRPMEPHIVCLRIGDRLVGVEFDEALDLLDLGTDELLETDTIGGGSGLFAGAVDHDGWTIRLLAPEKLVAPEEEVAELSPAPRPT